MAETWCRVCGKHYKICPSCENVKNRTPWRAIADTASHYQVWLTVSQYQAGLLSKETAQEILQRINISEAEIRGYIPSVQEIIAAINQIDKKSEVSDSVKENNVTKNNENVPNVSSKSKRRGRS